MAVTILRMMVVTTTVAPTMDQSFGAECRVEDLALADLVVLAARVADLVVSAAVALAVVDLMVGSSRP